MKKIVTTLLSLFILCYAELSHAQHGTFDLTFLPYDTTLFQSIGGTNNTVYETLMQPDGKILVGGDFTSYKNLPVNRLMRLLPNGNIDQTFSQAELVHTGAIRTIALQPDGKILVGGNITDWNGSPTSIVRLNADGTLDNTFSLPGNAMGAIMDIVVMPDGKIIVAGSYTNLGGSSYLRRLNSDGTPDNTFAIGTGPNNFVSNLALDPSGNLLVGGHFTMFNGTAVNGYLRLLNTGALDPSFTLNQVNDYVQEVLQQPDGKILIAGSAIVYRLESDGTLDPGYTQSSSTGVTMGGTLLSSGQLVVYGYDMVTLRNTDGTINTSFNVSLVSGSENVYAVTEQSNGDLIMGGDFVFVNEVPGQNLCGINLQGNVTPDPMGFNAMVYDINVQPDNKIIAGGFFNNYMGLPVHGMVRMFPNGEPDTAFINNLGSGFDMEVFDSYRLNDGRILVGGSFLHADGYSYTSIARVHSDGKVDTSFHPPVFDGSINSIDVLPDGKLLVAGGFNYVDGQPLYYLVRLHPDGALDNTFSAPFYNNVVFGMQAYKVVALPDGKILVGGRFACCYGVVRLHSNGSMDNTFNSLLSTYTVKDILPLSDGKILIGGIWSSFAGHSVQVMDRLLANGTTDPTFIHYDGGSSGYTSNSVNKLLRVSNDLILVCGTFTDFPVLKRGAFLINEDGIRDVAFDVSQSFEQNGNVTSVFDAGMQSDGRLIVAGHFQTLGSVRRNNIARLNRSIFIADTICSDEDYVFGSQIITNPVSGEYSEIFQSTIGTDSTVVLNLSVVEPNVTVVQNNQLLTSSCVNCEYQWLNCAGGIYTEIPGATNQMFDASQGGSFAVMVTFDGCSDTSACQWVSGVGYEELSESLLQLYPNPANDYFHIVFNESLESGIVFITDVTGKQVWKTSLNGQAELKAEILLAKGVYSVIVQSGNQQTSKKLIIQ